MISSDIKFGNNKQVPIKNKKNEDDYKKYEKFNKATLNLSIKDKISENNNDLIKYFNNNTFSKDDLRVILDTLKHPNKLQQSNNTNKTSLLNFRHGSKTWVFTGH